MKPEQRLWTRLRPKLKAYGHFERIENGVGAGAPDVDFCINGVEGKIELKYVAKYPARDSTGLLGWSGLRKEQKAWMTQRLSNGGRVFVLIGVGARNIYLLRITNHEMIRELNGMTTAMITQRACYIKYGAVNIDVEWIIRELTREYL